MSLVGNEIVTVADHFCKQGFALIISSTQNKINSQLILSQLGRKWFNLPLNGATQPVDTEEKGRSPTMDRQWLNENGLAQKSPFIVLK